MKLTDYRRFGRSGLVVSSLTLGTMAFRAGRRNVEDAAARSIFDAYLDAGGNFVDTADRFASCM